MNLAALKREVQRIFGDESGTFLEVTDIVNWLNLGQIEVVRKTHCLQGLVTANTVATTVSYVLPTDFLSMLNVSLNAIKLDEYEVNEGPEYGSSAGIYAPDAKYMLWENKIFFNLQEVQAVVPYTLMYLKLPATLASDSDVPSIPVEFHEDLVRYALIRAKEMEEDFSAAAEFSADFRNRLVDARSDTFNKKDDYYPTIKVLDWDE